MKTNKEFIDGIYKKVDEITKEKQVKKKNYMRKIINAAAIMIIVFTILINTNINEDLIQENNNSKDIYEAKINLKTIGDFSNFYEIVKKSYDVDELKYVEKLDTLNSALESNSTENATQSTDSVTNNQVENVDEADIVKVDNDFIYYISKDKVVIIDATKAEEAQKVAEITYEEEDFSAIELYVNKNKLIVIGSKYGNYLSTCGTSAFLECAYDTSKTRLKIYDVTNKKEPKEIRTIEIDGSYISSRMIEDNIYLGTSKIIFGSQISNNKIEDLNEDNYKPKYIDTAFGQEEKCISYDRIYCFNEMETTNYLLLAGLNLESNKEVDIQTFLGAGQYIYSSEKNMYVATINNKYDESYNFVSSNTHLLKFELKGGKIEFKAEADVDGQINNQFSMDENGQYFRIATTVGKLWDMDESTSNSLYILNDKLEQVGKITEFAKGEKIYSVRYVENKAYVVTFKQTDPLFVIDLSNPTKPQILGELKIPGYSTYLHPYDETHIIGFGYDTKEDGTRITTNGLKMAMFDISDVNNPKELFKTEIGDKNTSSSLVYNHKALLYSKEKNIIAFPVITYEKNKTYSRAEIYEIDLNKGFILKGKIANKDNEYDQRVERIVYVNDIFYTLSKKLVKAANMNTLQVINEIEI